MNFANRTAGESRRHAQAATLPVRRIIRSRRGMRLATGNTAPHRVTESYLFLCEDNAIIGAL